MFNPKPQNDYPDIEVVIPDKSREHLQELKDLLNVYSFQGIVAEIERLQGIEYAALRRLAVIRGKAHKATNETTKALYAGEQCALLSILSGNDQDSAVGDDAA